MQTTTDQTTTHTSPDTAPPPAYEGWDAMPTP